MDKINKHTFVTIFFIALALFFLINGTIGIINTKSQPLDTVWNTDISEGINVEGAIDLNTYNAMSIGHSVYFIPIATESYYYIYDETTDRYMVLRATEDLFEGFRSSDTINISGTIKKLKYDDRNDLIIPELNFASTTLFVDALAFRLNVIQIVGALLIFASIGCAYISVSSKSSNETLSTVFNWISSFFLLGTFFVMSYYFAFV